MATPGYSASTQASSSASAQQNGMFNDSGFVVNFGNGNATTPSATGSAAMPGWLLPALAVGAILWMTKHKH
jgi:hypothetical protein